MLIIFLWWSEGSHLLLDLIQAKNIWLMERDVIASKWKALPQAIHIRSQKTWNCLLRQCFMPNDMHIYIIVFACSSILQHCMFFFFKEDFHCSSLSFSMFWASATLLYCLLEIIFLQSISVSPTPFSLWLLAFLCASASFRPVQSSG